MFATSYIGPFRLGLNLASPTPISVPRMPQADVGLWSYRDGAVCAQNGG